MFMGSEVAHGFPANRCVLLPVSGRLYCSVAPRGAFPSRPLVGIPSAPVPNAPARAPPDDPHPLVRAISRALRSHPACDTRV